LSKAREARGSAAKLAGNVNVVAGTSAGAEKSFAARRRSDEDDVGNGDGRFAQVAAGERRFEGGGEGKKAVEETIEPLAG